MVYRRWPDACSLTVDHDDADPYSCLGIGPSGVLSHGAEPTRAAQLEPTQVEGELLSPQSSSQLDSPSAPFHSHPPPVPPKSSPRGSQAASALSSIATPFTLDTTSQSGASQNTLQRTIHNHRYTRSDPGHDSTSLVKSPARGLLSNYPPPLSSSSSRSAQPYPFPRRSISHSTPRASTHRARTMPGYRPTHISGHAHQLSLPARTFRDSAVLRPNSLDAILEAANTPYGEYRPLSSTIPPPSVSQPPSHGQYGSVYTGIPSPHEPDDLLDEASYPFPRASWFSTGDSMSTSSVGLSGCGSAEDGFTPGGEELSQRRPRKPSNKLKKTPPAVRSRKVSSASGRVSPGRRSPTRRGSPSRPGVRQAASPRRSPSRRSPSPSVVHVKGGRKLTFFSSFVRHKKTDAVKMDQDSGDGKEKTFQGMEAYVIEPFEDSVVKVSEGRHVRPTTHRASGGRPMSVTSQESGYSWVGTVVSGEECMGTAACSEGASALTSSP